MVGTYVALSELMETCYDKSLPLDMERFAVSKVNYAGDLSTFLEREDRYGIDTVYELSEEKMTDEDKVDDSIMIYGDSFGEFICIQADYVFTEGMEHAFIGDYNYNFYQAFEEKKAGFDPDIVLWVSTERYIDRLLK